MGSRSFLYGTFANWVELFQLAKAFDMGSRSFLYGTYANWVELFQLAKACAMGFVSTIP